LYKASIHMVMIFRDQHHPVLPCSFFDKKRIVQ
jgi:hypothetical protein